MATEPKPPTQLDDCIVQAANHSMGVDKALAELAELRKDAEKWREQQSRRDRILPPGTFVAENARETRNGN